MSTPQDKPEPLPAALGEVLGGYRLDRVLGAGGMGCVYAGTHARLGRRAAVKVLRGSLAHDPVFVARFFDEARVVNEIRHPNIIDIFDFVELDHPRRVACVMELIAGPTLREALGTPGLTPVQATNVAIQLCDALAAVHALGVVHRDLKPANILVCGELEGELDEVPAIKVLDFGIAKIKHLSDEHRTAAGLVLGTPAYMAPEQLAGEEVSAASDIYALGVVYYEMLTGSRLFQGPSSAVMKKKFVGDLGAMVLPETLRGGDEVRQLLREVVAPEPTDRLPLPRLRARLVDLRGRLIEESAGLPRTALMEALPVARPRTGRVDVPAALRKTSPEAAVTPAPTSRAGDELATHTPSPAPRPTAREATPAPVPTVLLTLPGTMTSGESVPLVGAVDAYAPTARIPFPEAPPAPSAPPVLGHEQTLTGAAMSFATPLPAAILAPAPSTQPPARTGLVVAFVVLLGVLTALIIALVRTPEDAPVVVPLEQEPPLPAHAGPAATRVAIADPATGAPPRGALTATSARPAEPPPSPDVAARDSAPRATPSPRVSVAPGPTASPKPSRARPRPPPSPSTVPPDDMAPW
jgi:serine/threonine-protein kinase